MPSFVYHTVLRIYVPSLSLPYYPFLRLTLRLSMAKRAKVYFTNTALSYKGNAPFGY